MHPDIPAVNDQSEFWIVQPQLTSTTWTPEETSTKGRSLSSIFPLGPERSVYFSESQKTLTPESGLERCGRQHPSEKGLRRSRRATPHASVRTSNILVNSPRPIEPPTRHQASRPNHYQRARFMRRAYVVKMSWCASPSRPAGCTGHDFGRAL